MKPSVKIAALLLSGVTVGALAVSAEADPRSNQPLGVATVATMIPGSDMHREVSAIAETGATAIRIPISWNLTEPSPDGPLQWRPIDDIVAEANRYGLQILLNLGGPAPVWAQRPGVDPTLSGNGPADPAVFGRFAEAAAHRYGAQVSMWEIWNEPNISHYLIPPTASTYLPILQEAYLGIRRAGSTAPVITGGTSSFAGAKITPQEYALSRTPDIDFIQALYDAGGSRFFDGIAVHPYSFPEPVQFDNGPGAIVDQTRQVMVEHGDAGKQIWITEFGQATGQTTVSTTERAQADILVDAINKSRHVPWIGGFFVFNTVDLSPNSPDPDYNFGLYHYDFTPKEVVGVMRSLATANG